MATVREIIPETLQPEVDAALGWFNETQETRFEVTGIIDPEGTMADRSPRALRLVLCGGDSCLQRSFLVTSAPSGFEVSLAAEEDAGSGNEATASTQAELDPPPGALRSWLSSSLARHQFVVLVFYRGFW